jgi:hypothetical protein
MVGNSLPSNIHNYKFKGSKWWHLLDFRHQRPKTTCVAFFNGGSPFWLRQLDF